MVEGARLESVFRFTPNEGSTKPVGFGRETKCSAPKRWKFFLLEKFTTIPLKPRWQNQKPSVLRACNNSTKLYSDHSKLWAGGRVVEGARLESVFRFTPNEGSNPSLSANLLANSLN